jgi:Kef-type K+ transport system membrane component KefB
MESFHGTGLLAIGIALLAGYLAHITGPLIHIPRVTLLLALGVVCGPSVLDVVPHQLAEWFPFVAHIALAMVGFLLGERFVGKELREKGAAVLWISVGETLTAAVVVLCALLAVGASLPLALLMAGIAPASAPAAIFETVREGRAKGPLTRTLLGVVAVDDAWGVITFSVLFVAAQAVAGGGNGVSQLLSGLWEVLGAVLVGAVVAAPMIWITRRIRRGEATLIEAMGFVLLCSGLASLLEVSYLLAAMTLGAVVANFAQRPRRAFHEIEGVSEPFLAIFFILAGLKLELDTVTTLGLIGATYIVARSVGLITGGVIAGRLGGAERDVRHRIGWCILPQAGVALGFALLVQEQLPDLGATVLPLVIATTVLFELLGPLAARWHLRRAGEWGAEETSE